MRMIHSLILALGLTVLTATLSVVVYAEVPAKKCRYELTDKERTIVEYAVYHEANNQSFAGQMLVAECFLNGCERLELRPLEAASAYGYHTPYNCDAYSVDQISQSVKDAVSAVFDKGYKVWLHECPIWYYNPEYVEDHYSSFHESKRYIATFEDHRFFGE